MIQSISQSINHLFVSGKCLQKTDRIETLTLSLIQPASKCMHWATLRRTWTQLANDIHRLQSFHIGCQRQILGVRWQDHVKNVDIADTTGLSNITDIVDNKRHALFGHVVRLDSGYQCTCSPSFETSHCNESWLLLRYERAKTSWSSSKDMDTADWRRNNNQLETDVAECRGTWTSWRAIATDHSRLRFTKKKKKKKKTSASYKVFPVLNKSLLTVLLHSTLYADDLDLS